MPQVIDKQRLLCCVAQGKRLRSRIVYTCRAMTQGATGCGADTACARITSQRDDDPLRAFSATRLRIRIGHTGLLRPVG